MNTQSATLHQIQVLPFYHDLRNQLVRPNDVLVCSHYFFRTWKKRLGPVLTLLVLELRDRCYRNKATGEVRDYCWPSQSELARSIGVSVDTIGRALKGEWANIFIRVEPRYRYDTKTRKKVRTSSIYRVAMDDPLLPEDEEALHELITKDVDNSTSVSLKPQNADQDSSRNLRYKEILEEVLNNVNDNKETSEDEKGRRDYLAGELSKQMGDEKNFGYYRSIVDKLPETILFETASLVKDLFRQGKIKKSRGALFASLIKQRCSHNDDGTLVDNIQ